MNSSSRVGHREVTLRQAALITGFGLLIMAILAPFAELYVYPAVVVASDVEQTVENLLSRRELFLAGLFCYLVTFIGDLVVAWSLYVLLAPVNRSLSLLTAWFRLAYTVIAFDGFLRLVIAYRLVNASEFMSLGGPEQMHAQIQVLLYSFRYAWNFGLLLFAIHLCLAGYLVYRSGYIPRVLGILLVIAGTGWLVQQLRPFLYPGADLRFLMITFFGELIFMLWLLMRGWKIREPAAPA